MPMLSQRLHEAVALKLEVHKGDDHVSINLIDKDKGEVGFLILSDVSSGHRLNIYCDYSVEVLADKVFGSKEVPVYYVSDVELQDEYRGLGWGKKMYEAAFKAVRPAIVVTGSCVSMGTSGEAARVWKSLVKKYPSAGESVRDMAVAVR